MATNWSNLPLWLQELEGLRAGLPEGSYVLPEGYGTAETSPYLPYYEPDQQAWYSQFGGSKPISDWGSFVDQMQAMAKADEEQARLYGPGGNPGIIQDYLSQVNQASGTNTDFKPFLEQVAQQHQAQFGQGYTLQSNPMQVIADVLRDSQQSQYAPNASQIAAGTNYAEDVNRAATGRDVPGFRSELRDATPFLMALGPLLQGAYGLETMGLGEVATADPVLRGGIDAAMAAQGTSPNLAPGTNLVGGSSNLYSNPELAMQGGNPFPAIPELSQQTLSSYIPPTNPDASIMFQAPQTGITPAELQPSGGFNLALPPEPAPSLMPETIQTTPLDMPFEPPVYNTGADPFALNAPVAPQGDLANLYYPSTGTSDMFAPAVNSGVDWNVGNIVNPTLEELSTGVPPSIDAMIPGLSVTDPTGAGITGLPSAVTGSTPPLIPPPNLFSDNPTDNGTTAPNLPNNTNVGNPLNQGNSLADSSAYQALLGVITGYLQQDRTREFSNQMNSMLDKLQAQQFPHSQYRNTANDYLTNPQARQQRLEQTPGYLASQQFAQQAQQRRNSATGQLNSGYGDTLTANVLGQNAQAWDKQMFDQIASASGMNINNVPAQAQFAQGALPAMFNAQTGADMVTLGGLNLAANALPNMFRNNNQTQSWF